VKRLGPELKMPDLKGLKDMSAPAWLADLYWDMRDRRLLPLIALVVVAIAAVPFLLGDSEEEAAPPVAEDVAAGEAAIGAEPTQLTVVEAKPGLRDYKKRLRRRTPTNPFKQKYTSIPGSAKVESTVAESPGDGGLGGSGATTTTEVEGSGGSPSDGSSPSPSEGSGGGGAGGGGDAKPPRLIAFVVDVQISRSEETADGGRKMGEPKVRRKVRPFTQLPGKKAPVVTTMGVNLRTATIMFLVSDDVRSLDGEFDCVSRTPDGLCELLEVEPGFPFEAIYGPNKVRYRFKVTKVGVVRAGRVGDKRNAAFDGRIGFGFAVVGQFGSMGDSGAR